jgi:hypothetical protein
MAVFHFFASDKGYGEQTITPAKGPKSMGHMTWLEPQVEQYRQRHALGTVARLALELLLNIAARRYDAHEIGPQHVIISNRDGVKKLLASAQDAAHHRQDVEDYGAAIIAGGA